MKNRLKYFFDSCVMILVLCLTKLSLQQLTDSFTSYQNIQSTAISVHYPSSTVFLANINKQIVQYNFSPTSALKTIQTLHKSSISSLAVSSDKKYILTGGSDFTARIYDYALSDQICIFEELRGDIISARIADDNNFYAVSSDEGYLYYGYISNCSKSIYNKTNFILSGLEIVTARKQIWVADGNTAVFAFNYGTQMVSSFTMPTSKVVSVLAMDGSLGVCTQRAFHMISYTGTVLFSIQNPTLYTSSCQIYSNTSNNYFLIAIHESTAYTLYGSPVVVLWNIWKIQTLTNTAYLFQQQANTANRYGSGRVCKDAHILAIGPQAIYVASIARLTNPYYNIYANTGTCSSGFSSSGSCEKCNWNSVRAYCTTCNSVQCTSCDILTYINTGSTKNCIACPSNCYTCTSSTICTSCVGGYTLISNSCLYSNLTGCVYSYPYSSSPYLVSKCYQCQTGYFPENNLQCKNCAEVFANCSQCTTTGCYKCNPNFFMAPSTNCQICSHAIEGCAACLNQTYCDTCYEQYPYYSLPSIGARICQQSCVPTCVTCDRDSISTCRSCNSNRTLTTSNTCICKPEFPIQNTATSLCQSCIDFLTNCINCTSSTFCVQCELNYYFQDTNSTHQTCQTCNYTCATCNVTWYKCATCDPTANRILDPVSGRCVCRDIHYFQMGSQLTCEQCSNHITNCDVCYNQTFCVTCNSGYYVKSTGIGTNKCDQCSAPCLQCFGNSSNCTSCDVGRKLNITVGTCDCLDGFFSISPLACAPCSPLLGSCLKCTTATTCDQCWANNYFVMVAGLKMCDLCQSTCLTCDVNTTICKTCDPLANRVLNTVTKQCDCVVGYTETNGRCLNCTATFQFCTACTAIRCLSCQPGYSLGFGGLKCVDCATTYPGCIQCLNGVCAACNQTSGFELSYSKCICRPGYYRKQLQCLAYNMGPPTQRLYPTYPLFNQDINTSLVMVMIYFQCQQLKFPYGLKNSVEMKLNNEILFDFYIYQLNTTLLFYFLPSKDMSFATIQIHIKNKTFYDSDQYGPKSKVFTFTKNIYLDAKYELADSFTLAYEKYIIPAVRWTSTLLLLLGCADFVLMLVFTVHLIPGFLLLNLSPPLPLFKVLNSMTKINNQSLFIFAEIKTGYQGYGEGIQQLYTQTFGLLGGLVHRKTTDLVFLGCVLVFYGIICPKLTPYIPEGRVKKMWTSKFELKKYSTISNSILCMIPSFLFCSIVDFRMIKFHPDSITTLAIAYILLSFCCVYVFFHAMVLYTTQFSDTEKNQDCYFGSSILEPKSITFILSLLIIGIWTVPMLGLLDGVASISILTAVIIWKISHFRFWDNFPLKILYFIKISYSVALLFFFISFLIFSIGEKYSSIEIPTLQLLGLIDLVMILILFALASLETLFLVGYFVYKSCKQSSNIVDNIEDEKQKAVQEQQYSNDASTMYNMKINYVERQEKAQEREQQIFNAKLTNKQEHMKKFKEQHVKTMGSSMYQQKLSTQDNFNKTGMSSVSKKGK